MPQLSLQRVPAPALVLVGIASVQTGSAIARTLFDDLGVAGTALWRLFLAALILLVVLRPSVRSWTRQHWRAAVLLGVALAGMNLVFYSSIDRIPLGVAVTVEFMGPLLLALGADSTSARLRVGRVGRDGRGLTGVELHGSGRTGGSGARLSCGSLLGGLHPG